MFGRLLIIIICWSNLKLGHIGSKTRLLGKILHSRGHSFDSKFTKLHQNVNHHNILVKFETSHVGSKTRSLGAVRDTSSNDTSSTMTLCRKFLSNYQFVEK